MRKIFAVLALFAASLVHAAGGSTGNGFVATGVPGMVNLYAGAGTGQVLQALPDLASCVAAAAKRATKVSTYTCRQSTSVNVTAIPVVPPAPPASAPPPAPAFTQVAAEDATFTIAAPIGKGYAVRYGAGSTWISRDLPAGAYTCDNATFTDPLVGTIKHCEQSAAQVSVPLAPPPNVPLPPETHMHGGVQGIDLDHPILANQDDDPIGGFRKGSDKLELTAATPLQPPRVDEAAEWEKSGAIRTFCKPSHFSYDDPLVYPGQPGAAHAHVMFRPGVDAFLTDANIRADGSFSTCRGGTLDLTARWSQVVYDTTTMRAWLPHGLLMYYKEDCEYDIDCSGYTELRTKIPDNVHFVPKGLHIIAGDPAATAPTGVTHFTCLVIATGNGRTPAFENQDAPPKCADDGTESLWISTDLPNCLAVNADGTPVLDSPNHKSHAAYKEAWPAWNSPTPGKAYRCPLDHPYQITKISFKQIYHIKPGMDTTKIGLSCGSIYCGHVDWWDGWDHDIMDKTSDECLAKARDCGTFQIFDGRTAAEFDGN